MTPAIPPPRMGRRVLAGLATALLLAACASRPPPPSAGPPPAPSAPAPEGEPETAASEWPQARGRVLARNERLLVYRSAPGDSPEGVAARFLGAASQAWQVNAANAATALASQQAWLVPLQPLNPLGVEPGRLQTVPILCYHRLGSGSSRMVVSPLNFEAQMNWLVDNDYRVIPLADLAAFMAGLRPLPPRSVVITFDDGYESFHRFAFPVLKKLRLPATLFVYTDFIGGGEALSWPQLQELQASGLVDIQSHSKSHRNLVERRPGETEQAYLASIAAELRVPREILEGRLSPHEVNRLAYPFGDANEQVLASATRQGVELAVTVVPGGNPFYADPLLLRRTMIFGDTGLDAFKSKLQISRALPAP